MTFAQLYKLIASERQILNSFFMNIDLGSAAHAFERRIEKQVIESLRKTSPFHNPMTNESSSTNPEDCGSCAKVSTPEPTNQMKVVRAKNGWTVQTNYDAICNETMQRFVYTKPQEVAGAVLGLITCGTPQSGVSIPDDKAIEAAYHDGYTAAMGERNANDAVDGAAAILAFGRGRLEARKELFKLQGLLETTKDALRISWEQNVQLRRVHDLTVAANAAHLDEIRKLKKSASEAYLRGKEQCAKELCGRYPWREIDELSAQLKSSAKASDGYCTLIARHEETHRKLQTEIDSLNLKIREVGGRNDTQFHTINLVRAQLNASLKANDEHLKTIDNLKGQVNRASSTIDYWQALAERKNKEYNDAREKLATLRKGLCPPKGARSPEFQVGDVWRSSNGQVRCIQSISLSDRLQYQHTLPSGAIVTDNSESFREFRFHVGQDAKVTRNAFVPARHPDEPSEGFMVGDVWTKPGGGIRIVVSVSEEVIQYDYRYNSTDTVPCIEDYGRQRESWNFDGMDGATLTRK